MVYAEIMVTSFILALLFGLIRSTLKGDKFLYSVFGWFFWSATICSVVGLLGVFLDALC